MSASRDIINILEYGNIQTTCKFGLLQSILDYIFENPLGNNRQGFHFIPFLELARKYLYYFWILTEQQIP